MVTWDDSFEIAVILRSRHPSIDLANVSLQMINQWVIHLPEFEDDLELVNDEILEAIYQEWYEEINPI